MMNFIKFPVHKGTPILNLGGHDWVDGLTFILRIAKTLEADSIQLHEAQQGIRGSDALKIQKIGGIGANEGRFLKDGKVVGRIIGLPVTEAILTAKMKVQKDIDAAAARLELLQQIKEMV